MSMIEPTSSNIGPIVPETPQTTPQSIGILHLDISTADEEAFQELTFEIEKLNWKNPTPISIIPSRLLALDIGTQPNQIIQPKYNVFFDYKWNIDNMTGYQILNLL